MDRRLAGDGATFTAIYTTVANFCYNLPLLLKNRVTGGELLHIISHHLFLLSPQWHKFTIQ
jgi:hypothetical protein